MSKRILVALLALLTLALLCSGCTTPPDPNTGITPGGDLGEGLENTNTEPVAEGTIKDSTVTWELYADGSLYIKGTGEMGDFDVNSGISTRQPWHDYIGNDMGTTVKKLYVEDGVTGISEGAFQGCINLESAEIAASVTTIPFQAFSHCTMLQRVRAKGVTEVEENAFEYCARLADVTFSASLCAVWDGAFLQAGTEISGTMILRLAGDQAEWDAAKAKMDASDADGWGIQNGNEVLLSAIESDLRFVGK